MMMIVVMIGMSGGWIGEQKTLSLHSLCDVWWKWTTAASIMSTDKSMLLAIDSEKDSSRLHVSCLVQKETADWLKVTLYWHVSLDKGKLTAILYTFIWGFDNVLFLFSPATLLFKQFHRACQWKRKPYLHIYRTRQLLKTEDFNIKTFTVEWRENR